MELSFPLICFGETFLRDIVEAVAEFQAFLEPQTRYALIEIIQYLQISCSAVLGVLGTYPLFLSNPFQRN